MIIGGIYINLAPHIGGISTKPVDPIFRTGREVPIEFFDEASLEPVEIPVQLLDAGKPIEIKVHGSNDPLSEADFLSMLEEPISDELQLVRFLSMLNPEELSSLKDEVGWFKGILDRVESAKRGVIQIPVR